MVLAASNLHNREEIETTLRHEVLGHYGINTFAPAQKRALLDRILETRQEPTLAAEWRHIENYRCKNIPDQQAEELFSYFAETSDQACGPLFYRMPGIMF